MDQQPRRSSSLGQTLSRTVSSLFPTLYRHSDIARLSDEQIYSALAQNDGSEKETTKDVEEEEEEFFEACSTSSSDKPEGFYDALDVPVETVPISGKQSPVSPLRVKGSLSNTERPVTFLEALTDESSVAEEMSMSSVLKASPISETLFITTPKKNGEGSESKPSSTPKSFTISTSSSRPSASPDSPRSFLEFLQESDTLDQGEPSEPMDLLTALRSDSNLLEDDEEIDLKTALESTSTLSEQLSIKSALKSPLSSLRETSSLSELRSVLGSSTNVEEDSFRRSLLAPPLEHKRKESFLKRTIPLAGFFADSSDNDDRFETDSMLSTLTEALTLKSTEPSTNAVRLSRAASVLIPNPGETDRLDDERKIKASRRYKPVPVKVKSKTKAEFSNLNLIQELNRNTGTASANSSNPSLIDSQPTSVDASRAIFALKFSPDGNYLAAAGAEGEIRIWRLLAQTILDRNAAAAGSNDPSAHLTSLEALKVATIFEEDPIQVLCGHEGEILDLAWSANNFLLSASMDKTVRLWHYSRPDCLGIFEHLDYVTSIAFHPRDPRVFVSGSLDCKLRLWSIQDKAIQTWNELPPGNFITAVAFTRTGKSVVAGTAGGIALIFETEGLRYHTQIHVRSSKSTKGKKITGIESVPGHFGDERIVVSSNDSRIRMYSLRDKNVVFKFKGHENDTSQIRASLSTDGEYVLSGSEDCRIYLWNADGRFQKKGFFSSFRKDHILSYESFKAHSNPVTAAVLAPSSVQNLLKSVQLRPLDSLQSDGQAQGQIIVTADITGQIKVFENNSRLQEWLS